MTENPVVQTATGKVLGQRRIAVYGQKFYSFEGIPYAKPPLGNLRFKSPLPVEAWQDVKDCTRVADKCLQWNRHFCVVEGSEDCLYLNIYVKALETSYRLPVMVYLHGGGFNTGSAMSWGPDYFMMKDVVLVTIGYRLGLFGYAHFKDKSLKIPGNAGLQDVILALKWIRDNCEYFNGDNGNITLFGHSAGSCATHLLMMSDAAKGLFHKAILMAGFSIDLPDIPDLQFRLAQYLGHDGSEDNEKGLCEFLTKTEGRKLVGFDLWTPGEKLSGQHYPFMPTAETYLDENSIITDHPVVMQRKAWSNNIPLMMGCTSNEFLIQYKKFTTDESIYESYGGYYPYLMPDGLRNITNTKLKLEAAKEIQKLHFGNKEVKIENYRCAIESASYQLYHSQHRIMRSRLRNASAHTYIYRFDFDSPYFNTYCLKYGDQKDSDVAHGDELSYIFFMPESFELDKDTPEFQCIEEMIECFYSFAKSSNPNNEKLQPVYWQEVRKTGKPICLNISYDRTEVIHIPEYKKCCIRDEIYIRAGVLLC